ncbi:MAG: energy transducer TonB [Paracoccus denitrificans]|nr:MAG: energy transducer TonB [Paracoccus denitrificans]PZO85500.1 MAG: energy transducer TonB [Paracoccus denitrificans]
MTDRGLGIAHKALWGSVAVLVVSAHMAAAAWLMRQEPAGLPAAADAIEVDLAPATTPDPSAIPELEPTSDPAPQEPAPEEDVPPPLPDDAPPPPDQPAPPEPLQPDMAEIPDFTPPPTVPLPPPDFASLSPRLTESQPPRQRPERPVEPEPEPEPEPERRETRREPEKPRQERRQAETPRREPARQAPARSAQSGGAPAGQAASNPRAEASWQQKLQSRVAAHMQRASIRGQRGTIRATVRISVSASGATSAQLVQGTGDPAVDAVLARQAQRMPKMPPPPGGAKTVTVPVAVQGR